MLKSLIILLAGASLCSAHAVYDINLRKHLEHFTTQRYPSSSFKDNLEDARKYIKDTFTNSGLLVKTQKFQTSVNTEISDFKPVDEEVTGYNIMGIAPARSNKGGAVIVVAADYDTNGIDDPMFNNGAGVAVLLETAYLFLYNARWSHEFAQDYTTIFVALDLNTKKHMNSGGKPGGWYFVNEWLWDYLNKTQMNFGGAYVIDSVMNLNLAENSQRVGDDFREMFEEASEEIEENGRKGDFLAMINLNNEKSLMLNQRFSTNYNKENFKRSFHLEDLTLPKSLSMSRLLVSLTRKDTIHFWAFEYKNVSTPLPALLLTDTETLRDHPRMDNCTGMCQLTSERDEFLSETTLALTRTLLAQQAHPIEPSAGALEKSFPALVISAVAFLLIKNRL